VSLLLQPNEYGSAAAVAGNIEVVKFLIQWAGANVNMTLEGGILGSDLAAEEAIGDADVMKILIAAGAHVNTHREGTTAVD
jgi:ankyrin repeat protein